MISIKQALDSIWHKPFSSGIFNFNEIVGYGDIKKVFVKAVSAKRPVHLLLVGSPGSAKTMFLTEVMRSIKESYFIVGSNTTKAGLVNQLFEKSPKFLLIDELDKMNGANQSSLLHLMETGLISETKINKSRQMELTSWVFATANSCEKIIEPLLSRFVILQVPEYTFEEFMEISVVRLAKEKVDKHTAEVIAENLWIEGSRDIRDIIKVARLANNAEEVSFIIKMMKRYSKPTKKPTLDLE